MRRRAITWKMVAAIPPPERRSLFVKAIICSLILCLFHSGCATSPNIPTPPTSEERASFGTVGVTRAYYLPETEVNAAYAKGRATGAAKGAGTYFGGVLLGGMMYLPPEPLKAAVYMALVGAVAAVALPVGAVVGEFKAIPGGEVASCGSLLREARERVSPQKYLRDELLRAGAGKTELLFVRVDDLGPTTIDNVATYDSLAEKGIPTVLEVSVERIALGATKTGSDPPLALIVDARSRLIRSVDGTIVNEMKFRHSSYFRNFAEWAADNAALLDKAYEDGVRDLAIAIIDWNFTKENGTG